MSRVIILFVIASAARQSPNVTANVKEIAALRSQ
jgi:hypothetical protein